MDAVLDTLKVEETAELPFVYKMDPELVVVEVNCTL